MAAATRVSSEAWTRATPMQTEMVAPRNSSQRSLSVLSDSRIIGHEWLA